MKQLVIVYLLLPLMCSAQKTFAPLGAVWNYEQKSNLDPQTGLCSGNHVQYRVEDELVIDGKDCSLVKAYRSTGGNPNFGYTGDSLVVFQDQDKIYFQEDTSFLLLFDFGAVPGDTIVKYDPFDRGYFSAGYYSDTDTTILRLEMVSEVWDTITINGELRRLLYFLDVDSDNTDNRDYILDGIGSVSAAFTGAFYFETADGCNSDFLCYKNDSLEYFHSTSNINVAHPGCDFTDSIEEDRVVEFNIFPNPFTVEIELETSLVDYQISIFDVNGRLVIQENDSSLIDTYSLDSGMYVIKLIDRGGMILSRKLVKL